MFIELVERWNPSICVIIMNTYSLYILLRSMLSGLVRFCFLFLRNVPIGIVTFSIVGRMTE